MSRDFPNNVANYLNIGDVSPIDFTSNSFTIMCWGHQDGFGNQRMWLVKMNNTTGGQYGIWVEGSGSGNPIITYGNSGSSSGTPGGAGPIGTTAFRCIIGRVGTGSGGVICFLDGASVATSTPGPTVGDTTHNLRFGRPTTGDDPMDGRLCEGAIWNVLLSTGEIAALARGLCARHVRPTALVGYWPLHGRSPEPDYSGRGHNQAVVNGSPNYHSTHARVSPFVLG